jgi:molybdopterin-containing oxidoreductase family iron-sulfur binding subunit
MLAKNRDGRIIKLEGNPGHPINRGALCPRGQASITHLYDPDRIQRPLRRTPSGFAPMTWPEAEEVLSEHLRGLVEKREPERLVFMTELITGPLRDLVATWSSLASDGIHVPAEPFLYEPLMRANRIVFGHDAIPAYRLDEADFLISFNAGFLETWLSNVEYARQFAVFREPKEDRKNFFAFVGPRQSMTAANADLYIPVAPGNEYLVGIGILLALLDGEGAKGQDQSFNSLVDGYSISGVVEQSGVPEQLLRALARRFSESERPLVIAEGLSWFSPHGAGAAVAANLLNSRRPGTRDLIQWSRPSAQGELSTEPGLKRLFERMRAGGIDLFLVHGANPAFTLPSSWDVGAALDAVPTVISFSSFMDETTAFSDFVFPAHTPLESWGEFSPRKGLAGLIQPVMGNLYDTLPLGDILIGSGRRAFGSEHFPWKDFHALLLQSWERKWKESAPDPSFQVYWSRVLQQGGEFVEEEERNGGPGRPAPEKFSFPPAPPGMQEGALRAVVYPTIQFYDGRMANSPWIQELPDPVTQVTWGGWAEIHPETARGLQIRKGDLLEIRSDYGLLTIPALPIPTVPRQTVALPLGQGHGAYGRFAERLPGNPMALFPPETDPVHGISPLTVSLRRNGGSFRIANTDGSLYEHGRHVLETTTLEKYREEISSRKKPDITLPLPSGWDRKIDFYDAHEHGDYRWSMVVDLDRCIGCGACVTACYAENNVAFVGREQILNGREMSWIRVQRYFLPEEDQVRWVVMLCQHCDAAPCESVCPIYAPHHSIDGLNNQIYNRCFGTRFCSQNDPYKVRRFNWYTWERPWPLDLQLNPDVTVRQKGIMEKCSFCIQRIAEAKINARENDRPVRDGDFTTACAQTCPTNALVFGNLKDPESRVSQLVRNPRAYQVLHHLNTKPAVIYLKRIEQKKA